MTWLLELVEIANDNPGMATWLLLGIIAGGSVVGIYFVRRSSERIQEYHETIKSIANSVVDIRSDLRVNEALQEQSAQAFREALYKLTQRADKTDEKMDYIDEKVTRAQSDIEYLKGGNN